MGKEADPKQGRGAGRRGEGTRSRPCPTSHPPTAGKPPHSEDMRAFRVPHPRPIHAKLSNQHTSKLTAISLPHLTVNPRPTSHSQIDGCCQAAHPTLDGRRQTAHPTREESVMAGSMQVPPMAMCGVDGFERPPTPLPIGACISFGFEYSNPKLMHVLFEGVKGGRSKPHQLHSLGKTLPRAGRTGDVLGACSHRAPGKTIPE